MVEWNGGIANSAKLISKVTTLCNKVDGLTNNLVRVMVWQHLACTIAINVKWNTVIPIITVTHLLAYHKYMYS